MKTTKLIAPLLGVIALGLLTLGPITQNKNSSLHLNFRHVLALDSNPPVGDDDPRQGGLLRYKFFVKEKDPLPNLVTLRRQNEVFAKYENKNITP